MFSAFRPDMRLRMSKTESIQIGEEDLKPLGFDKAVISEKAISKQNDKTPYFQPRFEKLLNNEEKLLVQKLSKVFVGETKPTLQNIFIRISLDA